MSIKQECSMESSKILAVILVLAVFVTESAHGSDCPQKYTRFSTHHSFCLEPNPTCSVIKSGVSENDQTEILKLHNEFRSKVAKGEESRAGGLPPAANMLEVEWDSELATIAQKWTSQCKFTHECSACRAVENFYVGQNLALEDMYCMLVDCTPLVKPDWKGMITMFYEGVSTFNKSYINPYRSNSSYGLFSQVVWAKSWRVGCGYVAFKNGDEIRSLYTCNYGPGGNFIDAPMYVQGNTCSACPSNTKCGNNGLCKVQDQSVGPVYEEKKSNLLNCNWKAGNSPCQVKIDGTDDWKLVRSLSGNYKTITLTGGKKSVMKMAAPIQPNGPTFCVVVDFRKGPANAANKDSSKLDLLLYIPEWNMNRSVNMDYTSIRFTRFEIDIGWKWKTEVSVAVYVPEGNTEHIFDIRKIEAFDGKCSNRN